MAPFFTVGHSNRSLDAFVALLRAANVGLVADIRRLPGSRAYPQFDADTLRDALAADRIGYDHIAALGGRRGKAPPGPELNGLWSNRSFRNYADYALTAPFQAGLQRLIDEGRGTPCALMCAEGLVALPSPHRGRLSAGPRRDRAPHHGRGPPRARPPDAGRGRPARRADPLPCRGAALGPRARLSPGRATPCLSAGPDWR